MENGTHRTKEENLITFQFKSNQSVSLHNGQSIGSVVQDINRKFITILRPSRVILSFVTGVKNHDDPLY